MTLERLDRLNAYFKSSKTVLEDAGKTHPDKFDSPASKIAVGIFSDIINLIEYVKTDKNIFENIPESDIAKDYESILDDAFQQSNSNTTQTTTDNEINVE